MLMVNLISNPKHPETFREARLVEIKSLHTAALMPYLAVTHCDQVAFLEDIDKEVLSDCRVSSQSQTTAVF